MSVITCDIVNIQYICDVYLLSSMLRLQSVSFSYQKQEKLYKSLSYDFGVSGITALRGISGSGKTTLLHIIWWLIKPQKWSVVFQWIAVNDLMHDQLARYRNKHIWFSFQEHTLLDDCSVQKNLMLPFLVWGGSPDKERYNHLVDVFMLSKLLHKSVQEISGGEKERVSLVKSFLHKPDVLLLDEPGDSLDEGLKKALRWLIQEYAQNNLVVLASHDALLIDALGLEKSLDVWSLHFLSSHKQW